MKTMNAHELKRWLDQDKDFTLINVLGEEDFERAHIPGSRNVPVDRDDFERQIERMAGSKDETIVVYCASHDCEASPKAARKLDEAGFREVYDFEGGIKSWMEADYDVKREQEEARV